jgi:hypothetical protein
MIYTHLRTLRIVKGVEGVYTVCAKFGIDIYSKILYFEVGWLVAPTVAEPISISPRSYKSWMASPNSLALLPKAFLTTLCITHSLSVVSLAIFFFIRSASLWHGVSATFSLIARVRSLQLYSAVSQAHWAASGVIIGGL